MLSHKRPNDLFSVFRVTGLSILGREGTHILFIIFYSGKTYNFMHFESLSIELP